MKTLTVTNSKHYGLKHVTVSNSYHYSMPSKIQLFNGNNRCSILPVSWSVVTAAVRPTPDEPRPVVATARGAV